MNALYDFFPTPQPKDSSRTGYYARLVIRDTVTPEDVAETIKSRSSLRQGDIIGSFIESTNVFEQELSSGSSIRIPGVGSFRIRTRSLKVRPPREIRVENIHRNRIVFTPEKDLFRKLKATTFEKVSETRRSQGLSDIEIDERLTGFFRNNSCITAQQLYPLCGLRKAIALCRLQKRADERKLTHPDYIHSPFYFPVPG